MAHPASYLNGVLAQFYKLNDLIIWDVHYTEILPFAFVQVIVSLLFIAYLAVLVVKVALPSRRDVMLILLTFLILANFPMLKGIAKVLKYDILSTLFSAIAILHYIRYRVRGQGGVAVIAIFSGLAYLEKDTSLSITLLICWVELLLIPFFSVSSWAALFAALCFVGKFALVTLVTCFVLVPKIWLEPSQIASIFDSVPLYFVNLQSFIVVLPIAVLSLAYLGLPVIRRWWPSVARVPITAVTASLSVVSLTVILLGASAVLFQANVLFDPTIVGNDLDVETLRAQAIYVARPIANSALTTLDGSPILQHIKVFWSMTRAIFYTLPEITLVLIVVAGPLFLLVARQKSVSNALHAGSIALLIFFPVAMLAAFALADLPFEPKYLVLVSLLLTIYGAYSLVVWLGQASFFLATTVQLTIGAMLVYTAMSAAPSYLRFKNILRDRIEENAASLDMNRYIWWTWPGWGETAYPIGQYIEANAVGPVTVAFDYRAPFYAAPKLTWLDADFQKCASIDDLSVRLDRLKGQSVDFLIVSKNMSNRQWCLNRILKRAQGKAIFVDMQQGVEYGWLFRLDDIREAFQLRPQN